MFENCRGSYVIGPLVSGFVNESRVVAIRAARVHQFGPPTAIVVEELPGYRRNGFTGRITPRGVVLRLLRVFYRIRL